MATALDPRLVFERLVLGAGNRMAAAAAERVAEAPGRSYNPLLVTGGPGLGKTHLLSAIAHRARQIDPELQVRYETAGEFVDRLTASLSAGTVDSLREASLRVGLWLVDDLQAVAGKQRTQEELFRLWGRLIPRGTQIVAALDRPLAAVPELHAGLASRLSHGLAVEIAPLDQETRAGVIRLLAGEQGLHLAGEVVDSLARLSLPDARELESAVARLAGAHAEGARIDAASVATLAGIGSRRSARTPGEFEGFVTDVSTAVAAAVETAPWRRRLAEAILRWEGEGIRTRRLEAALEADSAPDVDALLGAFARDVARLRELLRRLPEPPPGSFPADPDRLPEIEALAASFPPASGPAPAAAAPGTDGPVDGWFLDRARFAWEWVSLEERIVEEPR